MNPAQFLCVETPVEAPNPPPFSQYLAEKAALGIPPSQFDSVIEWLSSGEKQ